MASGVARLPGKSRRQKTEELINVAHPDFRAELRKEARSYSGPRKWLNLPSLIEP